MKITKENFYIGMFLFVLTFVGLSVNIGPVCMTGWAPQKGECTDIHK